MKERYPYGTFSGLSFPAQEVQAEARSPPPGDTEDVYNGRQSHLSPPHSTLFSQGSRKRLAGAPQSELGRESVSGVLS